MSWQPLATIQLTENWQLTEPILGNAFRLKHTVAANSPQELRAVIAQAYDENNLLTYFNDKVVTFRTELQGFIFPQVAGILNRKFAFKRLDNLADDWTITIEVLDGMPQSISLPIAVSEVQGLQAELDAKASSNSFNIHVTDFENPHGLTPAQIGAEPAGAGTAAATSAIATHKTEEDPHQQYATDATVALVQSAVNGKEAAGTAAQAIATHAAAVDHPVATTTTKGMMGAGDKGNLNKIVNYAALNVIKNTQSINSSADTILTFPTISSDSSSSWNTATNQWTCPATGSYIIGANIDLINNATVDNIFVLVYYKNNVFGRRIETNNANPPNTAVQLITTFALDLIAGDLIDLRIRCPLVTSTATISINANGMFFIQRTK